MTIVTFCFRAIDQGSWLKPIHIIRDGDFGQIRNIEQMYPEEFIYQVVLETDDDPEEILDELRQNGTVEVLLMTADGHEIFRSKNLSQICSKKK